MATTEDMTAQAAARQDFLREASDLGEGRLKDFHTFDQYYLGEQRALLMERARLYLERAGFRWAENFCETIIDILCERLTVEGFQVEDADQDTETDPDTGDTLSQSDDLAEWLNTVWEDNRMDGKQGDVHTQTAVKGEAGVIVDWDPIDNRPRLTFQRPDVLKFVYNEDNPDVLDYAVKVWNSTWQPPKDAAQTEGLPQGGGSEGLAAGTAIRRMNLYFPDRVEKWFSTEVDGAESAHWHVWMDEGDTGWPVMTVRPDGTPLGCLVVPFRNKSKGRRTGRSELRGVIPQQDLLNKQVLDLAGVMDNEGLPQRWATGIGDSTKTDFINAPGEVWLAGDKDATFGQFTAADPGPLIEAIDATLRRMAARSHTPLHLLNPTGVIPSGESLKTAEAPLVRKCQDRQTDWGNSWEDVMALCVRLHNDYSGEAAWPEELTIQTTWDDANSRNDFGEAQTAQIWNDIGVSAHTLMARAGFDPEEEAERKEEEAQKAFDRGQLAGLPIGPPPPTDDALPVTVPAGG